MTTVSLPKISSAILGNDIAIKASREGKLPFPDGSIIARLAWSYDPLEESSEAFGRPQSFVAGPLSDSVTDQYG
jgi:hypothetical protein